jgi:hypothetical protein
LKSGGGRSPADVHPDFTENNLFILFLILMEGVTLGEYKSSRDAL